MALRDLIEPLDRVRTIIRFLRERTSKKTSSHLVGVVDVLRQVAKYHCRHSDAEVDAIGNLLAKVRPEARLGMTAKNRDRLRELIRPENRGRLLTRPQDLLEQAQAPDLVPAQAGRLVSYAVALEILLVFPLRRSNLAALHLDRNLRYFDPQRAGVSHIVVEADESKNGDPMEWPIPEESADLIARYLTRHRPAIAEPANRYLFPGPGLKPRSAHELAQGLCKLLEREPGPEDQHAPAAPLRGLALPAAQPGLLRGGQENAGAPQDRGDHRLLHRPGDRGGGAAVRRDRY